MPATPGYRISLIYVCFMDCINNGVKLGTANVMSDRAYHLSLDWGMVNVKKSFYLQCTFQNHSNEVGSLERKILAILKSKDLKIKPRYPNGKEARGSGESEFFSYEGISLVSNIFNNLQHEGKGKVIYGFEPSRSLPPLRHEPRSVSYFNRLFF